MYVKRIIQIKKNLEDKSVLLLGARQTGKSYLLANQIKPDKYYNLLHYDTFQKIVNRPSQIREEIRDSDKLIAIDEIQKFPVLMDEVHAMIEEKGVKFILTGSSARKIRKSYTHLMGGRLRKMFLHPFVSQELDDFDLKKILNYGSLPPVYFSKNPEQELSDYTGLYLKEEIQEEALVRRIDHFARFINIASFSNGQLLNFNSIANDSGVPARTVREYFYILEDTLIGYMLHPIQYKKSRKVVSTSKFYFFDIGVANSFQKKHSIIEGTNDFGNSLEHFIYLELRHYLSYKMSDIPICFWRTYTGHEVDFIIGDEIAIEVKATKQATEKHLKGLISLSEYMKVKQKICVTNDSSSRTVNGIKIIPIKEFLKMLWDGEIIKI